MGVNIACVVDMSGKDLSELYVTSGADGKEAIIQLPTLYLSFLSCRVYLINMLLYCHSSFVQLPNLDRS